MANAYETLQARGFFYQVTDAEGLHELLEEPRCFYVGFDPTADSLHVGSLVPIMAMLQMQRHGHRPIAVVGGGTGMVGDPSGKTEARQLLTPEQLERNKVGLKAQLSRYLEFGGDQAMMVDNADWLMELSYVEFLRDIGVCFSVNRMLSAESVKQRLESESGLSFLEFNYQLLQAYDFLVLAERHDCLVQMGGQDQWGNIVAGTDLIRRKLSRQAYGATFPLIMNASGAKFGKTEAGTVWLDAGRTPPFDFYQFWRNCEDADLKRFLGLFTLLPVDEVERLAAAEGKLINRAKEILAYEATALCHGRDAAAEAYRAAVKQFGASDAEGRLQTSSAIREVAVAAVTDDGLPSTEIAASRLEGEGVAAIELFTECGLCKSRGEARRLVRGGGASVNQQKITDELARVTAADVSDGQILLSAGKKRHHRIVCG